MSPSDLAKIKAKFPVSKSVEKLSLDTGSGVESRHAAHPCEGKGDTNLCGGAAGICQTTSSGSSDPPARVLKRLRQSSKPLMNKLEAEFFEKIRNKYPNFPPVRPQAKTYRLANGLKYTPDFTASIWPAFLGPHSEMAWEVKGQWFTDDATAKLKMFAHEWPEICVLLVWKDQTGTWQEQKVLP